VPVKGQSERGHGVLMIALTIARTGQSLGPTWSVADVVRDLICNCEHCTGNQL